MSELRLTIDGRQITAEAGDTVLEAAQKAGIRIPTLCAHPALEPYGACRICIVQIEGVRGNPTSCTTPATDGMVVKTKTEEIVDIRREILKLMLSGHTSPCLVCSDKEECEKYRPNPFKAGKASRCTFCSNRDSCELRFLADEYEIDSLDLPIIYKGLDTELNDPFVDRDYSLCVLCGRCGRICEKIHGKGAIDFINRGKDARIGTSFHRAHTDTDCRFCGACIDICPTGSLTDRYAKWHGNPDESVTSTCTLCANGCSLYMNTLNGSLVSTGMTGFTADERICAVGRFVMPQIVNSLDRMTSHSVRVEDGIIKTSYEDAIEKAADGLSKYKGDQFALIASNSSSREENAVLEKFAKEVMGSNHFIVASDKDPLSVVDKLKESGIKALFTTGNYITPTDAEDLEFLVVSDLFEIDAHKNSDVIFASSALSESDGTFLNAKGEIKPLKAVSNPPLNVSFDWKIAVDIADKMGSSMGIESIETVACPEVSPPAAPVPNPIDDPKGLPGYFRGHRMADIACGLASITGEAEPIVSETDDEDKPFKIIEKVEIVPNTHMVTVSAPIIAEKCQAGQFVIAMVNEKSERIPYTISDFDREEGTITMVTLEVGRSSREMAQTRTGNHLAHITGPLGLPVEVKKYGTVVCAGGCFGVGAILPIARAMKEAGNRVICIEEASSHYLLHWQDKLEAACDELIIVTKDGSAGMKGGIQDAFAMIAKRGDKVDQSYVIGCTFMMMLVSKTNKNLKIPTQTAMNPIMLDGTGMCGACRVSEGDDTKFACVDGPFLDGLKINWDELMKRQSAFRTEEVVGLPQAPVSEREHSCSCNKG